MGRLEFQQVTTRLGDSGDSRTYSNELYAKSHEMFEVLGDLDELNSWLGVVHAHIADTTAPASVTATVEAVQEMLLRISALVATNPVNIVYGELTQVSERNVQELELAEKKLLSLVTFPDQFVIPYGNVSASVDYARTLTRRCERRLVGFIRSGVARDDLHPSQQYLNRLSDYFFVLARFLEKYD